MKGAQHSAKNTAKNISLIVLVVMLGVLCAANWLAGMNIAQMPADNLLRRAYDHLFGGAVGYELRSSGVSAAEPAQLALTVDGQLYGVQQVVVLCKIHRDNMRIVCLNLIVQQLFPQFVEVLKKMIMPIIKM